VADNMESPENYDLSGVDGAGTFRNLAPGLKLKLADGARGEIVENPRDGAYLLVKILECPDDPDRVGEEEMVYFKEIESVSIPSES